MASSDKNRSRSTSRRRRSESVESWRDVPTSSRALLPGGSKRVPPPARANARGNPRLVTASITEPAASGGEPTARVRPAAQAGRPDGDQGTPRASRESRSRGVRPLRRLLRAAGILGLLTARRKSGSGGHFETTYIPRLGGFIRWRSRPSWRETSRSVGKLAPAERTISSLPWLRGAYRRGGHRPAFERSDGLGRAEGARTRGPHETGATRNRAELEGPLDEAFASGAREWVAA